MTMFILTWDGKETGWPADDYARAVEATASGKVRSTTWSFGLRTSGTAKGDKVILLRQHEQRGIVAIGRLDNGQIRRGRHWDPAKRGKKANYVDVRWDVVLPVADRLPIEVLQAKASGRNWNAIFSSGQALDVKLEARVAKLWDEHLREVGNRTTPTDRLPRWIWEETVLAWDLYLREYQAPRENPSATQPAVAALSEELRGLKLHPAAERRDPRFRNSSGVARKLFNLMYVDTNGAFGSAHTSAMDRRVVADIPDLAEAARAAATIRQEWRTRSGTDHLDSEPPVTTNEFEALVALDGDLDREVTSRARREQRYLRQRLFGTDKEVPCALCGRRLPVNLLIAAHIKKRSVCTRAERLDVNNVIMAACALGCDLLFERGFIAVDDNGRVVGTPRPVSQPLQRVLSGLQGRGCSAHTPGSAGYFKAHRKSLLQ